MRQTDRKRKKERERERLSYLASEKERERHIEKQRERETDTDKTREREREIETKNGVLRKLKHIFPNTYQRIKSICSPAKGGTGCYRFNYQPGS